LKHYLEIKNKKNIIIRLLILLLSHGFKKGTFTMLNLCNMVTKIPKARPLTDANMIKKNIEASKLKRLFLDSTFKKKFSNKILIYHHCSQGQIHFDR